MVELRRDQLFERYRNEGDLAALGHLFDEVAPELYSIATHLARDRHAAEDLVQATFLAAIESRERWDSSRAVTAWLVGILANQAAYTRRTESRTPEIDRLAHRPPPEPSEEAEWAELRARMNTALGGVPAPYREVLTLHLREDRSAEQIANDLGRAQGTVRVQIHRGLGMLRRALAGAVPAGAALLLPPSGWAAMRAAVMERAGRAAPLPAVRVREKASAAEAALGTRASILSLIAASVGWVSFVGLFAWWWWPDTVEGRRNAVEQGLAAAQPKPAAFLEEDPYLSPSRRTSAASGEPALDSTSLDDSGWVVRGTVEFDRPTAPEKTLLTVSVIHTGNYSSSEEISGKCGNDGRFAIDASSLFSLDLADHVMQLVVRAEHPDCARAQHLFDVDSEQRYRRAGTEGPWVFETTIDLPTALWATGRVLHPDSAPLSGATVCLIPFAGGWPLQTDGPEDSVNTASDGTFRLRGSHPGKHIVAAIADGFLPAVLEIVLEKDGGGNAGDFLLSSGSQVTGIVRLFGQPAPEGTTLGIWPGKDATFVGGSTVHVGDSHLTWIDGRLVSQTQSTATDARGSFRFTALEPGNHQLLLEDVPGLDSCEWKAIDVDAPADDVEIDLTFSSIRLMVRDRDGPLEGVDCRLRDPTAEWSGFLRTGANGSACFHVTATSAYAVHVATDGYVEQSLQVQAPAVGEELLVEMELEPSTGALVLDLTGPTGSPPSHVLVGFFPLPETHAGQPDPLPDYVRPLLAREVAVRDSRVVLDGLPDGRFEVLVLPLQNRLAYRSYTPRELRSRFVGELANPHRFVCHPRVRLDLGPGENAERTVDFVSGGFIRLTRSASDGLPLTLECTLRTIDKQPVPILLWSKQPDNWKRSSNQSAEIGRTNPTWSLPAVPAGSYELEFSRTGKPPRIKRIEVQAGRVQDVRIDTEFD